MTLTDFLNKLEEIIAHNGFGHNPNKQADAYLLIKDFKKQLDESPEIPQDWQEWIEKEAEKKFTQWDQFFRATRPAFIEGATAMLPFIEELNDLKRWKKEAIAIMPDYQAIGEEIGVKLGQSVHDKILPAIKQLRQQISERDTEIERWKQRCEAAEDVLSFYDGFLMGEEEVIARDKWQQLKSQQP